MGKLFQLRSSLLMLLLAAALPCAAQIQLGDKLNLSANGSLSVGYSDAYGNVSSSNHSLGWGGNGSIDGSYYSPQFLSFSVQPYYDQSRASSGFQSISDSSGVNFSSAIFSGSHFPGSISYSRGYNSQGNFAVPGLPDYTTHGNSDSFGIGWGVNLPDLPTVSAQFQTGSNAYSIYGANADGNSNYKNFTLRSTYRAYGFDLNGGYSHGVSDSETPLVLSTEGTETGDTSSNVYNFNVSHRLPFNGTFSSSFSHSASDYSYSIGPTSGDTGVDTVTATASIHPWKKISFSGSTAYDDNLGGTITQTILSAGGVVPSTVEQPGSQSFSIVGEVGYQPLDSLSVYGEVQRRQQTWNNVDVGMDSYSGIVRYARKLFGGSFGASMSVAGNREDNDPGTVVSFSDTVSYSRQFGAWNVGGSFGYSQNAQTLLITYMSSNYNATANVRRRIGRLYWSASANTARTGLTVQQGSDASSEGFSTSISTGRWFALSGTYQKSDGTALQTLTGLAPTPIPNPIVNPSQLIFYNGHSYSISASTNPIKRLAFATSYTRAFSNTAGGIADSNNALEQLQISTHYQFRQMYFTGGYSRFIQGISVAGVPASQLSSFYVGVYRWFKFF